MSKRLEFQGQTFGRLVAIERAGCDTRGAALWLCRCDCGVELTVLAYSLKSGTTKSCGCLRREVAAARAAEASWNLTHGHAGRGKETKEYRAWIQAKARCFNPRDSGFSNYGGRGITMAEEWLDDFPAFFGHIGPAPGPGRGWSVDRIDNDRGYCPGNVRWASLVQQRNNRRSPTRPPPATVRGMTTT